MKYLKYLLVAWLISFGLSCSKFLDVQPRDAVSDEQTIIDKTSANTALRGVYRKLAADNYYGTLFQTFGYLPGDNVQWTGSQSVIQQFITHKINADNGNLQSVWSAIYATVNAANHIIAKVPGVQDATFTTAERRQIVGEAYFIRALCYFDLARVWGNVQITLTPTQSASDKSDLKNSSQAEVYAQVLNDLNAADSLLIPPASANPVRANQETVWALKARYYLYQGDWAQAVTYAGKVLADKSNYVLQRPYSAFFSPASAVATKESVFELSYSATYPNSHRNSWQPPVNSGTRQWAPSDAFVALVNDPLIGGNRNALVAKTSAGLWYGNLYYRSSPAVDPTYVIRIAEVYLIRAEALAQQGKTEDAKKDLDAIRDRAGLQPTTADSKEAVLLAIENERRVEFAFEPHRWFDLVRTKRAGAVLNLTDTRLYLFPIPANEIALANGNLKQNPGYE
ncbi:tetratricopeptide (TPR) repeat protein [Chitinophaga terrae (ex Kim and Jung 2007)]|uniref:RagB/SusD family nutrient uptake outer membrane protein n=1 Tax=Chitinophaga terrae (ex Kim and Jung 2007) TaxID=408074 RepID=UPI0027815E3B|nr:RagB/SusD family nutrient uptake outer membrane protein [Chitinophaga terrae (ex Kim and Jung 2007)]MDQ0106493.1 tetratricopeptide (TPR) repeat protein [Chitinophaga terrae (ex Kim and Jung 2007)]